jgi:hypothetical protein
VSDGSGVSGSYAVTVGAAHAVSNMNAVPFVRGSGVGYAAGVGSVVSEGFASIHMSPPERVIPVKGLDRRLVAGEQRRVLEPTGLNRRQSIGEQRRVIGAGPQTRVIMVPPDDRDAGDE